MPAPDFDLYLVTDRRLIQRRDVYWTLEQALDGGVKAVQIREKDLEGGELFRLAERVQRLCKRYRAALFINDRIDVALSVQADGVQLGKNSLPLNIARELLGRERMIGASTHSLAEASEAQHQGADFILFGPVFFTPSKAVYGAPQGLAALRKIVENISVPVYAIGGVNAQNVEEVMNLGVHGVALISAVMAELDPKASTRRMLDILHQGS